MRLVLIPVAALLAAIALSPAAASAAGPYNSPSSVSQCLGVGFGAGYHAPWLLSPPWRASAAAQRIRWVPARFAPPATGDFDHPSAFGHYAGMQPAGYGDAQAAFPGMVDPYDSPRPAAPAAGGGKYGPELVPAPAPTR